MSTAGWIAIFVVALMIFGLTKLARPREFSDEEFERESKRPSLLRTGLQEFQGFIEPEKKAAIEAVQEEKRKTNQEVSGAPPSNTHAKT